MEVLYALYILIYIDNDLIKDKMAFKLNFLFMRLRKKLKL